MNIEGVGPALIDQLLTEELVTDVADLYYLEQEELMALDRMAEKSSQNVLSALENSKDNSLAQVIYGLGIRYVGSRVAQVLAQNFADIDEIIAADEEDLVGVDEIGPKIAEMVRTYFSEEQNLEIIEKLKAAGINFESEVQEREAALEGKKFVLTGSLDDFTRKEATAEITKLGGRVTSSISGATDYLVVGANPGSKYDQAQELETTILNEEEFKEIIER
jgi:DNA ligase (NAD+)